MVRETVKARLARNRVEIEHIAKQKKPPALRDHLGARQATSDQLLPSMDYQRFAALMQAMDQINGAMAGGSNSKNRKSPDDIAA